MTSASELFFNRRSRSGRNSVDLGLDSIPPERSFLHSPTSHGRRNHRHDLDGCDPLRRYPHSRININNNRVFHQDRGSFRAEEIPIHFGLEDSIGSSGSRTMHSPTERLPGDVLLARARLRERLRGVPPTEIRQRTRASTNVNNGRIVWDHSSNQRLEASGWETDNVTGWWSTNSSTFTTNDSTRLQLSNKKPVGLTQEALDCLQLELFSGSKEPEAVSTDCCICLESFSSGEELINLPCNHRFHSACLRPWVSSRGDCPYCRRVIVVKNRTTMNNPL